MTSTSVFTRPIRGDNPVLTIKHTFQDHSNLVVRCKKSSFENYIEHFKDMTITEVERFLTIAWSEIMFSPPSQKVYITTINSSNNSDDVPERGDPLYIPANIQVYYCARYIVKNMLIPITDNEE